ncbi:hypothetical protein D3C75_1050550 [compost metagenome]
MAGESIEIAIQILHIHLHMRSALSSVHNDYRAVAVGNRSKFFNRISDPHYVGYISDRHNLSLIRDRVLGIFQRNGSVLLQRDEFQGCPSILGQLLPWNKVAVMLHLGNDDFVAFTHCGRAVGGSYNIQRRSRPACEDNLFGTAGMNELCHLLACTFVSICRPAA